MISKLIDREKKLLIGGAVVVLLFFSVQFVILPLSKSIQEKTAQYDQLSMQKTMVELKINQEQALRQSYAAAKTAYDTLLQSYPLELPNEEIDNLLTGLALNTGLQATQLSIADPVPLQLQPPAADSNASESEPAAQENQQEQPPASVVRVSTSSMNLLGNYTTINTLIDLVDQKPNLRLLRCVMRPTAEEGAVTNGEQFLSLIFEVSMLEKR